MTSRIIKTPGTVATPRLGKYSPLRFVLNANGSNPLHAGWLLGVDYHIGAPSEGAPLTDLSGNGHTLTRTGANASAGVKAKHAIGNGSDYWTTSFTADQLGAAGTPNELAVIAVALAPPTTGESLRFVDSSANAGGAGGRYISHFTSNTFDASVTMNDTVGLTNRNFSSPVEPDRASEYFLWGANFSLSSMGVYMENDGEEVIPYTTGDVTTVGVTKQVGGGAIRIVTSNVNTYNFKVAALLFYNRNLTPSEMKTVLAKLRMLFANYGVTV